MKSSSSRRDFIKTTAVTIAGAALAGKTHSIAAAVGPPGTMPQSISKGVLLGMLPKKIEVKS